MVADRPSATRSVRQSSEVGQFRRTDEEIQAQILLILIEEISGRSVSGHLKNVRYLSKS